VASSGWSDKWAQNRGERHTSKHKGQASSSSSSWDMIKGNNKRYIYLRNIDISQPKLGNNGLTTETWSRTRRCVRSGKKRYPSLLTCPPTYLSTYIPAYLPTYLPTYLHAYLRTYLPTYLPTNLTTYLPDYLPTWLPTYLTTDLQTYIPTYLMYKHKYIRI